MSWEAAHTSRTVLPRTALLSCKANCRWNHTNVLSLPQGEWDLQMDKSQFGGQHPVSSALPSKGKMEGESREQVISKRHPFLESDNNQGNPQRSHVEPKVSPCIDVAFTMKSLLWEESEQLSDQTLLLLIPQAPAKYYLHASKRDDWTRHGTICSWETEAGV